MNEYIIGMLVKHGKVKIGVIRFDERKGILPK